MPGSVFAFLNGFGQQGWVDMSIMNIEVLAGIVSSLRREQA